MPMKDSVTLAAAFAGAFFIIGLPYWQIPYSQASLPSDIWGPGLFAVVALAAIPRVVSATRFWPTFLVVGAAVPAAVCASRRRDLIGPNISQSVAIGDYSFSRPRIFGGCSGRSCRRASGSSRWRITRSATEDAYRKRSLQFC